MKKVGGGKRFQVIDPLTGPVSVQNVKGVKKRSFFLLTRNYFLQSLPVLRMECSQVILIKEYGLNHVATSKGS